MLVPIPKAAEALAALNRLLAQLREAEIRRAEHVARIDVLARLQGGAR